MLQFRIRSLFGLILVAAIYLGVAQTAGYAVATGILIAISVLTWAVFWRRHGVFLYLRLGSAVFALVAIWFLAVDWSGFLTHCPDCEYWRTAAQYRVLGIPVRTQVWDSPSKTQRILDDLGVPCEHASIERYHDRYWGLLFLARPSIPCIILTDDYPSDYTDADTAKLRQLGVENPQRAAEMHDLIIRQHKHLTFWKAIEDLTADATVETEYP